MSYTVQLNIGSLATPAIGGGWLNVICDLSNAKVKKGHGPDDLITRTEIDGKIKFEDTEYLTLKTLFDAGDINVPMRLYYLTTKQADLSLSLTGVYYTDIHVCELETVASDLYGKINAGLNNEVTLTGSYDRYVKHNYITSIRYRYQVYAFGETGSYISWTNYTYKDTVTASSWSLGNSYIASGVSGSYPNLYFGYTFNNVFVTNGGSTYACIADHTATSITEPGVGASWEAYWVRTEVDILRYSQEYGNLPFDGATKVGDEYQKGSASSGTYLFTWAGYQIFNILSDLLSEIDPSIELYETTSGANTGYCQYIENNFIEKHYKVFYSYDSITPSKPKKIKLSDILEFFKKVHNCNWRFEGNIFVFRHESERPTTVSSVNFSNYQSADWTTYKIDYSKLAEIKKETWKFGDSSNEDFDKMEIIYNNDFDTTIDNQLNSFSTDIKNGIEEESGDFIIAASQSGSDWLLNNTTGIISGGTAYNGELSTSQCIVDHFQNGRPYASYDSWTGGTSLTLIKKRNLGIELKAPVRDVTTIDLENYIFTITGNYIEIQEISIPLDYDFALIRGNLTT